MSRNRLNESLRKEVLQLQAEGRAKPAERIITAYLPPQGSKGPRYRIAGEENTFLRINSNNYLNLSTHPKLIEAADKAAKEFGVGPGAVRFIDGTYNHHNTLETEIADFVQQPAACIFNSAYTTNLAMALTLCGEKTYWIGDALNHNSIIRAMRIANVPKSQRAIYAHNDMGSLKECLAAVPKDMERVCILFDGVFSMRGDHAPMAEINEVISPFKDQFKEGVFTVVDDSHGIGAFGASGRGTMEITNTEADIVIGTFGKAFGVNGGFIASSKEVIQTIRQKADTYIYTNPLSMADCAAISASIAIVKSDEGKEMLKQLRKHTSLFRTEIEGMGYETLPGIHPVVPILIRDTPKTHQMIQALFEKGILAVGLTFPVVPKGQETIRIQINAGLTEEDILYTLACFKDLKNKI